MKERQSSAITTHQYKTTKMLRNQFFRSLCFSCTLFLQLKALDALTLPQRIYACCSITSICVCICVSVSISVCHIVFYNQNLLDAFALKMAIATMKLP